MTELTTALVAAAAVVLLALVLIVLLVVRSRSSRSGAPQELPGRVGHPSPTAIVCPFCKREYDPAETGGRCPGCGAAAPRRR